MIEQALQTALRHHQAGQLAEAEQLYRQILARQPSHADVLHLLGVLAHQTGRNDIAVDLIRRALSLRPDWPEALGNIGSPLQALGRLDEAVAVYRRAIELNPRYAGAYGNLGNALREKGELDEAIAAFHQAIALKPDFADVHNSLGIALQAKGRLDDAVACFRRAIALRPGYPQALNNLGTAVSAQARHPEAIGCFRSAIAAGVYPQAHSNLLLTLNYDADADDRAVAEEARRWNAGYAHPLRPCIRPHDNDPSPDRRLRVGYFSPLFHLSSEARFLLPALQERDRDRFEVFCYSNGHRADWMTERLRNSVDEWHNIARLSDRSVADLVRQHRIDIAVDLMLHGANNRLLVFAQKPAPVQVSYLAYCGTTGLETVDYRLSDPYLDAPDADDSIYSERTIRLPDTYWCYKPIIAPLDPGPLPASTGVSITFGCLNSFPKITEPVLAAWSEILRCLPGSRLLLHALEGSPRQRVCQQFERGGVNPRRIEFAGFQPTEAYFKLYRRIDISLDTFPCAGGTTTCDALWMGVPVVSLVGSRAVGRYGLSVLSNLGLPELAARSVEEYVHLAKDLARDPARLGVLRSTLRQRMERSPLMDEPGFARNLEAAYRRMWRTWCSSKGR